MIVNSMASRGRSTCSSAMDCGICTCMRSRNHVLTSLLVFVLLVTHCSFLASVSSAGSTVINVPRDYSTIQAAVNAASPGNTIVVEMGVWTENVNLNKTLTLIAKEKYSTVIYANNTRRPVVEITANNVKVIGFTIRNGSRGVEIESSNGSLLFNNKIVSNDGFGVSLNLSNFTTIEGCVVSSNNVDGVYLELSHNNTITESAIYSNLWYGMYLSESTNNSVFSNIIANNQKGGIYLEESSNNSFVENSILSNDYFGIELYSSSDSTFHLNNFADNDDQVFTAASANYWNVTGEGNHWSDYTDVDDYSGPYQNETGGDGIWDHPYVIDVNNRDNYPLINSWAPVREFDATKGLNTYKVTVVCNSSVTEFNFNESLDQISFYMVGAVGIYGFCNVTIPKQLLLPIGYPWLVFSNEVNITSNTIVTENSTYTSLYFGFNFSATPVMIRVVATSDTDPPQADAGPDQIVAEDMRVIFNGSASQDNVEIIDFTWTFFDVTAQILKGKTPTYIFYTPGLYIVSLNVTDVGGNWDTDSVSILVLDITPPEANAGDDQTIDEDTQFMFNGSRSFDNVGISSYVWTFTDVNIQTLTEPNPAYVFNAPGTYTVMLNVTDFSGNWNTDIVNITVRDITKPIAVISNLDAEEFEKGVSITFDGSESSDNAEIVGYEWNFGDGATATGITVSHTYENLGNYTVTLKAKDAVGNEGTASISVTIVEGFPWLTITVVTVVAGSAAVLIFGLLWYKRRRSREVSNLKNRNLMTLLFFLNAKNIVRM